MRNFRGWAALWPHPKGSIGTKYPLPLVIGWGTLCALNPLDFGALQVALDRDGEHGVARQALEADPGQGSRWEAEPHVNLIALCVHLTPCCKVQT